MSPSGKNSSGKKRGPILLKRKAKTTSFFDTNKTSAEGMFNFYNYFNWCVHMVYL